MKKARCDKRQSFSGASTAPDVHLKGKLPQETDDVFTDASDVPSFTSLGTVRMEHGALKAGQGKKGGVAVHPGSSASLESDKPQVSTAPASAHSLLDLLANQALAPEEPFTVHQGLLAAAVAKYNNSAQPRIFGFNAKSPPLPPAPPQSSPMGFPASGACHMVLPQLQQDAGHEQMVSTDAEIIIL